MVDLAHVIRIKIAPLGMGVFQTPVLRYNAACVTRIGNVKKENIATDRVGLRDFVRVSIVTPTGVSLAGIVGRHPMEQAAGRVIKEIIVALSSTNVEFYSQHLPVTVNDKAIAVPAVKFVKLKAGRVNHILVVRVFAAIFPVAHQPQPRQNHRRHPPHKPWLREKLIATKSLVNSILRLADVIHPLRPLKIHVLNVMQKQRFA